MAPGSGGKIRLACFDNSAGQQRTETHYPGIHLILLIRKVVCLQDLSCRGRMGRGIWGWPFEALPVSSDVKATHDIGP